MRIIGAGRLARTARAASADLADVPLDAAAAVLAAATRARAPRRTGALAMSVAAFGDVVTVGADYSGVIEGGWRAHGIEPQPYLTPAVEATEDARTAAVEADVRRILDQIAGA